jgi:hypothetical protein
MDVCEKNAQVNLMRKIYSQAAGVAVCFAHNEMPDHDARQAANLIDRIYKDLMANTRQLDKGITNDEDLDTLYSQATHSGNLPQLDDAQHCRYLGSFFGSAWFARVWCVQEISLAKNATVMFGAREQLPWAAAGATSAWINAVRRHGNSLSRDIWRIPNVWGAYSMFLAKRYKPNQLLFALLDFQHCQSSDPRDKIYALLGLIEDRADGSPCLNVQYDRSIRKVYIDAATSILESTADLSLLSARNFGSAKIPTWVPTWNRDKIGVSTFTHTPESWNACSSRTLQYKILSSGSLRLRGYTFQTITSSSSTFRFDEHDDLFCDNPKLYHLPRLWKTEHKTNRDPKDQIGLQEMIAFTLTMGLWQNTRPVKELEKAQFFADFNALMSKLFTESFWDAYPVVIGKPTKSLEGKAGRYFSAMSRALNRRKIIYTSEGMVGVGPSEIEIGDHIVVLDGGAVPYVLRPMNDGTGEYMFINSCYFHHIMHGDISYESSRKEHGNSDSKERKRRMQSYVLR